MRVEAGSLQAETATLGFHVFPEAVGALTGCVQRRGGTEMNTDVGILPATVLFIEPLLCFRCFKVVYVRSLLFSQNNSAR